MLTQGDGRCYLAAAMFYRASNAKQRSLVEVAYGQGGHFTAAQARTAGYPKQLHSYHVKRGNWLRVGHGLYRLRWWPPSAHEDLVRWTVWSGMVAVVSHETALAVHDMSTTMPDKIHLTVPPGFRKRPPSNLVLHRGKLSVHETEQRDWFRVTPPLRTLIDAAEVGLGVVRLSHGMREALRKGLLAREHIEVALAKLHGPAAERLLRAYLKVQNAA